MTTIYLRAYCELKREPGAHDIRRGADRQDTPQRLLDKVPEAVSPRLSPVHAQLNSLDALSTTIVCEPFDSVLAMTDHIRKLKAFVVGRFAYDGL